MFDAADMVLRWINKYKMPLINVWEPDKEHVVFVVKTGNPTLSGTICIDLNTGNSYPVSILSEPDLFLNAPPVPESRRKLLGKE